jgi:subtilisin family serine protease
MRLNRLRILTAFLSLFGLLSTTSFFVAAPAFSETSERYIVKYVDSADEDEEDSDRSSRKIRTENKIDKAFKGAVVKMTATQASQLRTNSRVAVIEKDGIVHTTAEQLNPVWGLDRIDQKSLPLNNSYSYTSTVSGVKVYLIDTGILPTHNEFSGRMLTGYSPISGGSTVDCNGHGTHVAGTIGGSTYGVAKGVSLVPVRVLDCFGSGFISDVVSGVNWVIGQYTTGSKAVISMSLGGGVSSILDSAINAAITKGITVVVAAGNSSANACNYSPARVPSAITVGATDINDALASFSNTGSCVDISAPGVNVVSAYYLSNTSTATLSGTSMATPHVSGAVALELEASYKTPSQIQAALNSYSGTFLTTRFSTSTRLLNTNVSAANPPAPPTPPASGLFAPTAPRTVKISVPKQNGRLNISWIAPSLVGSGVTTYTARAWSTFSGGSIISSCTSANLTCQITGLRNRTNYSIDVIATGPGGTSPASSPRITVRTY